MMQINTLRMRCYLHYPYNYFIDYFDDPVPDDTVIYAGHVLLQYNEQEGTYTEFFGNPMHCVILAASRDHEFLLNHRSTTSHVSCIPIESRRPIVTTSTTLVPTQLVACQCHLWTKVAHDMPATLPEKEMLR